MTVTSEAVYSYLVQDVSIREVTEKKIRRFGEFENGWHYGEGVSFEQSVLDNAIALNREAIRLAFYETDAFPGTDGEVMLVVYSGDYDLEFVFERDGSVTFCHERGDEEICYRERLSLQDARTIIAKFREKTWKESGFLASGFMIVGEAGLEVLHSGTPEMTQESRLLAENVYSNLEEPSVDISKGTIPESRQPLLFFGVSQHIFYQPTIG